MQTLQNLGSSVSSTVGGWTAPVGGWISAGGQWISGTKAQVAAQLPPTPQVFAPAKASTGEVAARAALGALAVTGGAALLGAAWMHWGPRPFPRGRQSRSRSSAPFDGEGGACPHPAVAGHFYTQVQFGFVRLSQGRVRYLLRSPPTGSGSSSSSSTASAPTFAATGAAATAPTAPVAECNGRPVVVLVHGFSIAADIWKQVADHLLSRGFTVLSFDNYGRGWSDAPDPESTSYDYRLYVGQLAELLFALNIRGPVDLCGVSMGGSIASNFAVAYPEKVNRLCLVCPAGLPIASNATFSGLMSVPVLGALAFKRVVSQMQARGAAAQWEDAEGAAFHAWHAYAAQNVRSHPGFVRTLHRTVVEYPMDDQSANYALIAQNRRLPVLLLWGDRDGLTPYRNAAVLHDLLPGSQLVTIVDAKHNMLIERAQPIAEVIAAWLTDSDAKLPARVHTTLHDQSQIEGQ